MRELSLIGSVLNSVLERSVTDHRVLKLAADVLSENRKYAERNRRYLCERHVRMLNLVSSPGAGKTTLLTETIGELEWNGAFDSHLFPS